MPKLKIGYDDHAKARKYNSVILPVLEELSNRPNIDLIPFHTEINPKEKFNVLISWAVGRYLDYGQKIAYLPHGISPWKDTGHRSKINHYFCASKYEIGKYFNARKSTCDVVGWPKLDYLVANKSNRKVFKEELIKQFNLNPKLPIIAYMPTWSYPGETRLLTPDQKVSFRQILNRRGTIRRMLEDGFPKFENMILAPHHADITAVHTEKIIANYPTLFTGKNKNTLLLGCDLIIGDISSVLIESLVLDIPIIHLTNGHEGMFMAYKDHSHRLMCCLGPYAHNPKDLIKLVEESLSVDKYKNLRHQWRDRFIYTPKETATVAAANAIERLAKKNIK
jgi:hypothetical protein